MENFDFNERPVTREKNVFLLHLDVPRIILICAVLIGIIVTTFLLGMNFSENKVVSHNALVMPEIPGDTLAQLDKGIDITNSTQNPDLPLIDNTTKMDMTPKVDEPTKLDINPKQDIADATMSKNNQSQTEQVIHDTVHKENIVKNVPKKNVKAKATIKKNKVVEVAKTDETHLKHISQRSWSIQIASYNTLTKAQKEAKSLQTMKYDAYVDKADVSGKTYYRVKVGPILKEDKAISMLQEIQSIDKYKESYIVKE
ncbi:MAG: SPOR domain-containing protein [Spirochaetes bacterium]|nr:SPOR domain-containing protein [Spirochaetota bacterium]